MARKRKKKTMTFADRAKAIKKKYPRAAWDTIEKNALNKELDTLVEEQEAYRNAMGMNEAEGKPSITSNQSNMMQQPQMRGGGALGAYFNVRNNPMGYDQYAYGGMNVSPYVGNAKMTYQTGGGEPVVTEVEEPASVDFEKVIESLRERSPKDIHGYFLSPEGSNLPLERKRQIYQGLVQDYPLQLQEQYDPQEGSYSVGFQDVVEGYSRNPKYYGDEDVSTYGVRYGSGFYEPVEQMEFQDRPMDMEGTQYRTITDKSPQYSLTPSEYKSTRGYGYGGKTMYQIGGPYEDPVAALDAELGIDPYATQPAEFQPTQVEVGKLLSDRRADRIKRRQSGDALTRREVLPSVISGAGAVLGNVLLAGRDRKAAPTQAQQVTAEQVDFSPIEQSLRERAGLEGRIARRNLRTAARTRGEYLAGIGATSAALQRELGSQLADLQVREDLTNAEKRQRANELNAQYRAQAQQVDMAREEARQQRQRDYLASIIETPGAVARDIRSVAAQKRRDKTIAAGKSVLPPEIVQQLLQSYQG